MIDGRDFQARYWASDLLTPIPFLVELRGTVLARSHTRCPKWRFKLAPDLALQVQPRLGERRDRFALFKCTAIQGEDLSAPTSTGATPPPGIWAF